MRRPAPLILRIATAVALLVGSLAGAVAAAPPAQAALPGPYTALTPVRLLDTRAANGIATRTPVPAKGTVTVQVGGRGGVPATASAVVVNLTIVDAAGAGNAAVWPAGTGLPGASNVNYVARQTVANQAIVKLGTGGRLSVYTYSSAHVLLDVAGYYPAGSGNFVGLTPARIVDTRTRLGATRLASGVTKTVSVLGRGGVPTSGVSSVAVNVTAVNPDRAGNLAVFPAGAAVPTASNLNYTARQTVPALAVTKVGTNGQIALRSYGATDVIVDVAGYFKNGSDYVGLAPSRRLDTRTPARRLPARGTVDVKVTGAGGVPATGVQAVMVNVTAVNPAAAGNLAVYPSGTGPTTSTLNYAAGQTVANSVLARVNAAGVVTVASYAAADVIVDVQGYVVGNPVPPPTPAPPKLSWSPASASLGRPQGYITAVSCAGSAFCLAGDLYGNVSFDRAGSWTPAQLVDDAGVTAISCPTADFCAVGTYSGAVYTWTGAGFVRAGVSPDSITGLSCPVAGACVAVDASGRGSRLAAGSWSAPTSLGADVGQPTALACATVDACTAVDDTGRAWRLAGGSWTPSTVADGALLTSVACPTADGCVAGDATGRLFRDAGSWRLDDSLPAPVTTVTCDSATHCLAATSGDLRATFDGTRWTTASEGAATAASCGTDTFCMLGDAAGLLWPAGRTDAASRGTLLLVNTLAAADCTADGTCAVIARNGEVVVRRSTGQVVKTNPFGNTLAGDVTCADATHCTALAYDGRIARLAGDTWTLDPAPLPLAGDAVASSLSCPTATFCLATATGGQSFTFDGTSWTPRPMPALSAPQVSCPTASFCAAVEAGARVTTWTGSTWSPPATVPGASAFSDVDCASASACVAVDDAGHASRFDGRTFAAAATIAAGVPLTGVSCPTATKCLVSGADGTIRQWNGASWANLGAVSAGALWGVACGSTTFCAALTDDRQLLIGTASAAGASARTSGQAAKPRHERRPVPAGLLERPVRRLG